MIRTSCVLLAVIGLLLQGSQGGHMLLVEHARCAEHGELVHGDGVHEYGPASAEPPSSPAIDHAPDLGDESAHEHCNHVSERRDAAAEVPASHQVAEGKVEPVALTPRALALDERTPRYRTAPKTSPPA